MNPKEQKIRILREQMRRAFGRFEEHMMMVEISKDPDEAPEAHFQIIMESLISINVIAGYLCQMVEADRTAKAISNHLVNEKSQQAKSPTILRDWTSTRPYNRNPS